VGISEALRVLGIKSTGGLSADVVKSAYRELAKKYHPDLGSTEEQRKELESKMKLINIAKEVIDESLDSINSSNVGSKSNNAAIVVSLADLIKIYNGDTVESYAGNLDRGIIEKEKDNIVVEIAYTINVNGVAEVKNAYKAKNDADVYNINTTVNCKESAVDLKVSLMDKEIAVKFSSDIQLKFSLKYGIKIVIAIDRKSIH
jgi:DnaJ-class molecular chaperone